MGEPTAEVLAIAVVEVAWPEVVEGSAGDEDGIDNAQDRVTDRDEGTLGAPPCCQSVVLRTEVGVGPTAGLHFPPDAIGPRPAGICELIVEQSC